MANFLRFLAFFVALVVLSDCKARKARWFRNTVTELVTIDQIVTTLVPSSCLKVDPTLPPCRLAKQLEMNNLRTFPKIIATRIQTMDLDEVKPTEYPRQLEGSQSEVGWAEYLGLVAPTVIETVINLKTVSYPDPRYVVTFSVKGCRPSKLPVDNLCPLGPTAVTMAPQPAPHSAAVEDAFPVEAVTNLTSSGLADGVN